MVPASVPAIASACAVGRPSSRSICTMASTSWAATIQSVSLRQVAARRLAIASNCGPESGALETASGNCAAAEMRTAMFFWASGSRLSCRKSTDSAVARKRAMMNALVARSESSPSVNFLKPLTNSTP